MRGGGHARCFPTSCSPGDRGDGGEGQGRRMVGQPRLGERRVLRDVHSAGASGRLGGALASSHSPHPLRISLSQDLLHWSVGFVDWNILLDQHGGPDHGDPTGELCEGLIPCGSDAMVIADLSVSPPVLHKQAFYWVRRVSTSPPFCPYTGTPSAVHGSRVALRRPRVYAPRHGPLPVGPQHDAGDPGGRLRHAGLAHGRRAHECGRRGAGGRRQRRAVRCVERDAAAALHPDVGVLALHDSLETTPKRVPMDLPSRCRLPSESDSIDTHISKAKFKRVLQSTPPCASTVAWCSRQGN